MKGLTPYQLEGIREIRKLFAMHYQGGPLTSIEAADAKLLQLYGHPKDEGCEAFPVEASWVEAVAKARAERIRRHRLPKSCVINKEDRHE